MAVNINNLDMLCSYKLDIHQDEKSLIPFTCHMKMEEREKKRQTKLTYYKK